jgi:hypothetical protein
MNSNSLREKLIRIGAQARLSDLNKERQELFKILGLNDKGRVLVVPEQIIDSVKADKQVRELNTKAAEIKANIKKVHWTQTKAGRDRMSKIMKAKYASGWKSK